MNLEDRAFQREADEWRIVWTAGFQHGWHVPLRAWWNNEDDPGSTHSQSRLGWMAAGYTAIADRTTRQVVFRRFAR
ncbi:hypothetical protein [Dactylosporangium sp. NPDC051541]|uniref:hypothetical protein n=1 Tax=Dactylosporangium sp. NPDC051541 TaxID=3363977 RepID=UPI00378D9C23